MMRTYFAALALVGLASAASAAATTYNVDPDHTHPSFEVDHFGGLSVWRGLFKKTTGTVVVDPKGMAGSVDITVDTSSIDLAHDKLNEHVSGPEILDVAKYPTATYKGTLGGFANGAPTTVTGNLTLHGVTKPVTWQVTAQFTDTRITGSATANVNITDFGMTPPKAGPVLAIEDGLGLELAFTATRAA